MLSYKNESFGDDAETWPDDANANLELLIHDVDQLKSKSIGYEKIMWERVGTELEKENIRYSI